MTSKKSTRIALVGAGLIGQRHADLLMRAENAELTAIVDPAEEGAAFAARQCVPWFRDLTQLLDHQLCDGVILATPNHLHFTQAQSCLQAGLPCLVEKPITADLAEAEALCQLTQTTNVPLLVGHHRAYSPAIERAQAVIAAGMIGDPIGLSGTAIWLKPASYFAAGAWRTGQGGGPILINMIHEVGSLRTLLGEITTVQAMSAHQIRGRAVEETVAITLEFANGALGSFLLCDAGASTRSWEQTAGEDPNFPHHPNQSAYHITGTCGALDIPTLQLFTYAADIEPSWSHPLQSQTLEVVKADPLVRQLDHFIEIIGGRTAPRVDAKAGYRNLAVTMAIAQAAETQSRVAIQNLLT